jgi:hypothetical protein
MIEFDVSASVPVVVDDPNPFVASEAPSGEAANPRVDDISRYATVSALFALNVIEVTLLVKIVHHISVDCAFPASFSPAPIRVHVPPPASGPIDVETGS